MTNLLLLSCDERSELQLPLKSTEEEDKEETQEATAGLAAANVAAEAVLSEPDGIKWH